MNNEENKLGIARGYINGFTNLFSFINIYRGKDSLGDKIINSTNCKPGPVDHPIPFALGYLSELTIEIATPIYLACAYDSIRWYHVILADLALKIIPRGLEYIINKKI